MPVKKDWVLWTWSDERDGQFPVGNTLSPWFEVQGSSKILIQGDVANGAGATTIFVEQSVDGVTVDFTSSNQAGSIAGGAEANLSFPYARVRVTQATAITTNAELAVKLSD